MNSPARLAIQGASRTNVWLSRLLFFTWTGGCLLSVLAGTAWPEQSDKEKVPDKSPAQLHNAGQSQPPAETQPAPPKLSGETKPQPRVTPPAKIDNPPEHEVKEKETSKRPVGSLILTVKLALLADSRLFHYELDAEGDEQAITLTGRVSSEEEKIIASEITRLVPGVKAVANKLEVSKDLSRALARKQDDNITGLVKERFAKSATLKTANFDVKTEEGVVSLSGVVRFQVIVLEAAEAARHVPGVRAVKTEKVRLEGEG